MPRNLRAHVLGEEAAGADKALPLLNLITILHHTTGTWNMNKYATSCLAIGIAVVGLNGTSLAFSVDSSESHLRCRAGIGVSLPIASNETEEGRAENRWVEVLVLGRVK